MYEKRNVMRRSIYSLRNEIDVWS